MYNSMANEDSKIIMIAAVNETVKLKQKQPYADAEDIMPKIMPLISNLSKKEETKLHAIAGVDLAIKYMDKNPKAKEKEIFQFILDNSSEMISPLNPD